MDTIDITINDDGTLRFIHNDDLTDLMHMGATTIKRASHVEPNARGEWEADVSATHNNHDTRAAERVAI